jgi:uncharacterized membrane protein YdjX (TVP38/TMEM64 family)
MKLPATPFKLRLIVGPVIIAVLIAACVVLCIVFRNDLWALATDPQQLTAWIAGLGAWGPIAFVGVQIIQVVIFIIPGEIPQVAGGMLFGILGGTVLSTIGIALGSTINFYLARLLKDRFVERLMSRERIARFQKIFSSSKSMVVYLLLFLIPGIPKDVIAYAAGLSRIRFGAFIALSSVGRMPGLIVSVCAGQALVAKNWLAAGLLLGAGAVLLVLGIIFRAPIMRFIETHCFVKDCDPPEQSDAPSTGAAETNQGKIISGPHEETGNLSGNSHGRNRNGR